MKPYCTTLLAFGFLASSAAYAQQAQSDQKTGQQAGSHQELSSRYVKQIQSRLRQQGYYDGKATGAWDEDTSDALQNFQDANGIPASGELDGLTIFVLDIPVPGGGQGQQSSQAGYSAAQDRSTSDANRSARQVGQGDEGRLIDAYHAGYQKGLEQGFKQSQATGAMQQGQGTMGQGSSQPPQQDRRGQQ
jgi:uncharacterized Ntn-hydrolase superfamily protein